CDVVDTHEQRLAFNIGKADVQVARKAMFHGPVDVDLVEAAHDLVFQAVTKSGKLAAFLCHVFGSNRARFPQTNDSGYVQGSGTHAPLVAAAVDDGRNLHARVLATHIERADTFRAVNLVCRDRHKVDVVLGYVDGNFAHGLNAVRVEQNSAFAAELADFTPRLQNTNFVVGSHDRDKDRLVIDGALEIVEIDQAVFLHGQVGYAIAVFLQTLTGVENGFVLGHRGDDVVALLAIHLRHALDSEVVAFCGSRCEDDFLGGRANQLGDALTSELDGFFGRPSKRMIAARGVAELFHEIRQHLFEDTRIHGSCRMVVHVDRQFDAIGGSSLFVGLHIRAHDCFSYNSVTSSVACFEPVLAGSGSSFIWEILIRFNTSSIL